MISKILYTIFIIQTITVHIRQNQISETFRYNYTYKTPLKSTIFTFLSCKDITNVNLTSIIIYYFIFRNLKRYENSGNISIY